MSILYKIIPLSFLALTLFSLFFTYFTIYTFYGIKFATNRLKLQILDVVIDNQTQQIIMRIKIQNNYWVQLKIKYMYYRLFYNYREVGNGEYFFSVPICIPAYSTCYVNFTFPLNIEIKTSDGIWKLDIERMVLITDIKEGISEIELEFKGR